MKRIITIGREFGAGGGTLGRRLAKELGIEYYDRDIILATAKASAHLTPEQVRQWDERVPKEFGFTQSLFNFYSKPLGEELWNAQVHAIRELANKESCVIVGRNADYILKEYDHCLRVFVHADRSWRLLLMRQEYALLLAALIALIDALPVFGTGTVLVPWAAVECLLGAVPRGIALLALFAVISVVRSVLEPKLMAAQAGLPPLASLCAMYVGFCAMGVAGMVLAPMALMLVKQLRDGGYIRLWR